MRAAFAWVQHDFVAALDEAPRFLEPHLLRRALHSGNSMIDLLNALSHDAMTRDLPRWNVVPKLHQLMHMLADMEADRVNPTSTHAFTDEVFMMHVIEIAGSVHRAGVCEKTLSRWRMQALQRWLEL